MNIDDLTLGQIKQLRVIFGDGKCDDGHPYEIGEAYFIRTVTFHLTGRLVEVTSQELVIEDAAWIADDGRFADALKTGAFSEVEPYPDGKVIIGRGALIDAQKVKFSLPRSQK
jgi:hypothetical protein